MHVSHAPGRRGEGTPKLLATDPPHSGLLLAQRRSASRKAWWTAHDTAVGTPLAPDTPVACHCRRRRRLQARVQRWEPRRHALPLHHFAVPTRQEAPPPPPPRLAWRSLAQ